jgi:endonuclease/exonuclease/phosphatase family metal-dependent hydrolase
VLLLSTFNKTIVKKILSLCLFAWSLSLPAQAQKHTYSVLAVGSYNCENLFDTEDDTTKMDEDFTPGGSYSYTPQVYHEKLQNIAHVIELMGTDVTPDGPAVLGLVEIENNRVLEDLVKEPVIQNRHYEFVWFPTPDVRGISNALLYNPKYFKVLNARHVTVPLESLGQSRPTRDVLHVTGILAGDTVHVMVNHWPSKSGGEAATNPGRNLAARVNKQVVDSLMATDPNSKIIILGDLNDNPTCHAVIDVLGASDEKDKTPKSGIYNPWIKMYRKGMGTESYHGEWNLIDQIMISEPFLTNKNKKWGYYKNEIFNKEFLINKMGKDKGLPHRSFTIGHVWDKGYSDHFPVLMYFIKEN